MEQFVVRAYDGKGMLEKRLEVRPRQMGTTQKAVQKKLVSIVEKLRHHDDSIQLWKYLNR
jgi:hypothetical protein